MFKDGLFFLHFLCLRILYKYFSMHKGKKRTRQGPETAGFAENKAALPPLRIRKRPRFFASAGLADIAGNNINMAQRLERVNCKC
jgi:hypothetical protein